MFRKDKDKDKKNPVKSMPPERVAELYLKELDALWIFRNNNNAKDFNYPDGSHPALELGRSLQWMMDSKKGYKASSEMQSVFENFTKIAKDYIDVMMDDKKMKSFPNIKKGTQEDFVRSFAPLLPLMCQLAAVLPVLLNDLQSIENIETRYGVIRGGGADSPVLPRAQIEDQLCRTLVSGICQQFADVALPLYDNGKGKMSAELYQKIYQQTAGLFEMVIQNQEKLREIYRRNEGVGNLDVSQCVKEVSDLLSKMLEERNDKIDRLMISDAKSGPLSAAVQSSIASDKQVRKAVSVVVDQMRPPILTSQSEKLPGQKTSKEKSSTARSLDALGVSPAVVRKDKQKKEEAKADKKAEKELEKMRAGSEKRVKAQLAEAAKAKADAEAQAQEFKELEAKGLAGKMPENLGDDGKISPRNKNN